MLMGLVGLGKPADWRIFVISRQPGLAYRVLPLAE